MAENLQVQNKDRAISINGCENSFQKNKKFRIKSKTNAQHCSKSISKMIRKNLNETKNRLNSSLGDVLNLYLPTLSNYFFINAFLNVFGLFSGLGHFCMIFVHDKRQFLYYP